MQTTAGDTDALQPRLLGAVALGGAIGASARWSVAELVQALTDTPPPDAFPWATFVVNVTGALLIAVAAARLIRGSTAWAFAVTGVLGGFTTMSALAIELNDLADVGRNTTAAAYLIATLIVSTFAYLAAERFSDARLTSTNTGSQRAR